MTAKLLEVFSWSTLLGFVAILIAVIGWPASRPYVHRMWAGVLVGAALGTLAGSVLGAWLR